MTKNKIHGSQVGKKKNCLKYGEKYFFYFFSPLLANKANKKTRYQLKSYIQPY